MAGAKVKPYYEDFDPYCKWRIENGQETLEIHLHGFRKEQVRVQISSLGNMIITGERRVDESRRNRFRREFKVPKECKTNEISAKLSRGILCIVMPKKSTLPSSQDQITAPGQNQENEQTKPKINKDNVTKDSPTQNLAGAVENNDMTTENATMLATRPTSGTMWLKDAVFRFKMRKNMGLKVAVAVVVMVAFVTFVIYKHRQPPHVEN